MKIKNRLTKIESITKSRKKPIVWDLSRLSDEQLFKLKELTLKGKAESYVKQLINEGLLNYS